MPIINRDILEFKNTFQDKGIVKLPVFLGPEVLKILSKSFESTFNKRLILGERSSEFTMSNDSLFVKMNIIFNSSEFLDVLSEFLGRPVKKTSQRVYYIDSSCVNLPWHDDSDYNDGRIASMRLELSDTEYDGGEFYFKDNDEIILKSGQLNFGESLFFKIEHGHFFHMVLPVKSGIRKSLIIFLWE